jgi:hypothetical protein
VPTFDGTGPRGEGPMTGRGEGHCAIVLPEGGRAPYGYAGVQGQPVGPAPPTIRSARAARFGYWPRRVMWLRRGLGRGWRRGAGRGRGRRFGRR